MIVNRKPAAADFLRLLQRQIGISQKIVRDWSVVGYPHDTDRYANGDMPALQHNRMLKGVNDLMSDVFYMGDQIFVGKNDSEFIIAEAGSEIGDANDVGQNIGSDLQQFIASFMAKRVIDHFELIDINSHQDFRLTGSFRLNNALFDPLFEFRPVGKPGKGIEIGQLFQLMFGYFSAVNVRSNTAPADVFTRLCEDRLGGKRPPGVPVCRGPDLEVFERRHLLDFDEKFFKTFRLNQLFQTLSDKRLA